MKKNYLFFSCVVWFLVLGFATIETRWSGESFETFFLIDGMVNQNEWLFEFAQLEWFAISNRPKNMKHEDEGTLKLLKSQKIGAHSGF